MSAYLALLNLLKQAPWRDRRHRSTLAWKVLRHASSSVAFRDYRGVLGFAARLLRGREVLLLADRGFAHLDLLGWARGAPGWHYRVRGKRDLRLYRWGGKGYRRLALRLSAGEVRHYHGVMAVATLVLVCQGVAVVDAGKRRQVDRLALLTARDPEPARASRRRPDRSRWMDNLPCGYVFLFPAPSTT